MSEETEGTQNGDIEIADKKGLTQRLLDGIETVGNKVPHPVLMFLYLIIGVIRALAHPLFGRRQRHRTDRGGSPCACRA